jgi:hypothetical protein
MKTLPRKVESLPAHVYCRDCREFVPWLVNQDEIICGPAHHVVATFSDPGAKRSGAAS